MEVELHYHIPAHSLKLQSFNFEINGVSRCLMQELARHRTASFSVKSTRYTLKKDLKEEKEFNPTDYERASKYLVMTDDLLVNQMSIKALENLRKLVDVGISNDILKYAMPEAYKVDLFITFNGDGLKNFIELRTSPAALKEIRELAFKMYEAIPESEKELFKDVLNG